MKQPVTIVANSPDELEEALVTVAYSLITRDPEVMLQLCNDHRLVMSAVPCIPAPDNFDPKFFQGFCMGLEAGLKAVVDGRINMRIIKTYEE